MGKSCLSRTYTRTHTGHPVLQGEGCSWFLWRLKSTTEKKKKQEQKKGKKKSRKTKTSNSIYTCIFTYRKSKELFISLSLK